MLEIGAGLVLAIVICGVFKVCVALHRRRRDILGYYRTQFFDTADRLLRDEATDDESLTRLKRMVEDIDSFATLKRLTHAVAIVNKELRSGINKPPTSRHAPSEWGTLLFNYFLAVSYSKPIFGMRVRSMMAPILDPKTESQNAEIIDRRIHRSHPQPA
jgi:hypothetical protein